MPPIASAAGPSLSAGDDAADDLAGVRAHEPVELAHHVELLRNDAVRQRDAAGVLVLDADAHAGVAGARPCRCARERIRVVDELRRVAADLDARVDAGAETAEVAELRVDDHAGREDGLALAQERVLVAGRQDDARDHRDAEAGARGVEQPDLRVDRDVAQALLREGVDLVVDVGRRRARVGRIAAAVEHRHRHDHAQLEAEVRELGQADGALQRRRDDVVDREAVVLGRRPELLGAVQHQRFAPPRSSPGRTRSRRDRERPTN